MIIALPPPFGPCVKRETLRMLYKLCLASQLDRIRSKTDVFAGNTPDDGLR